MAGLGSRGRAREQIGEEGLGQITRTFQELLKCLDSKQSLKGSIREEGEAIKVAMPGH